MRDLVIAALRRKREAYERAGQTDRVERIDARLAGLRTDAGALEGDSGLGVDLTPAAQAKAEELGLTAEDFKRRRPSGKTGFTVGDVERIAESRKTADEADDATNDEGDD